ncbi:type IX secretion system plug protein [Aestuariibaculum sediminum]|uniref:DUF5103 domain-containing protein n=1 Tax=Aestuariibaculum sediminum TaxID=2770637 RepID=A0A8J6QAY8_9FLAO|nr:DUF5103 domain-containing protein [Aestuariibaculum sediminum]MBD0832431.1 DUF5103 domain-containing protein [Aestuariibaculum sediminum]
MKINSWLVLHIFLFSFLGFSQVEETNPPDYIKTINFKGNTPETQLPILRLGEHLILEFDALNGLEEDYYYKIDHYNYDWTPSVLLKSEYLTGFDNQRIRDYENSYNTYQIYSHYKLSIPNQFTKEIKLSGNYILSIFNSYNELIFSRKFMVYEEQSGVGVSIKRSRSIEHLDEKQRVDIVINPNGSAFNNPMQTVKVMIVQNNNLNTAILGLKPLYTIGKQLIYKYDTETSFWGGNEFLYFENKDVRGANTGVQRIDLKDVYHNYLFTNIPRYNRPYTYNPDINGNYVITNIDAENPSIEADYVWIHFSLVADDNYRNKNIHVYGNFNNYVIEDNTQLIYDESRDIFSTSLLLKQGFYNYKYVVVNSNNTIDHGAVSGNFYQTENNYKVIVYYRDLGARYDKIIGVGEGSSVNISN